MDDKSPGTGRWMRYSEFLLILLAGLIFVALVIGGVQGPLSSPLAMLRLVLALFLGTFASGYIIHVALFPQRSVLHLVERVALSFGISVSILPLFGLILSLLPWKITLWPIIIGLGTIMVSTAIIAIYRRSRLPEADRPFFHLSLNWWGWWHHQHTTSRLFLSLLAVMLCGIIIIVAVILLIPKTGESLTEFYILGAENIAETYPNDGIIGQPMTVKLGVMDLEGEQASYTIIINSNGKVLQQIGPLALSNNQQWLKDVSFLMPIVGEHQRVEFILERQGYPPPYRILQLWMNVRAAE